MCARVRSEITPADHHYRQNLARHHVSSTGCSSVMSRQMNSCNSKKSMSRNHAYCDTEVNCGLMLCACRCRAPATRRVWCMTTSSSTAPRSPSPTQITGSTLMQALTAPAQVSFRHTDAHAAGCQTGLGLGSFAVGPAVLINVNKQLHQLCFMLLANDQTQLLMLSPLYGANNSSLT